MHDCLSAIRGAAYRVFSHTTTSSAESLHFCKNTVSSLKTMDAFLPSLPVWAQQLASIIPFLALIEFIDVRSKLHIFELSGRVPLWSWPITPAGARCLFSKEDSQDSCILDHPGRSPVLECLDGRHGDHYPSSTPTTSRLCCSSQALTCVIDNEHYDRDLTGARPQRLDVFRVDRIPGNESNCRSSLAVPPWMNSSSRYLLLNVLGSIFWILAFVFSIVARSWVAALYLLLIPLTGLIVGITHGGRPRQLRAGRGEYERLIVATESLNSSNWWAFHGESMTLNALLNQPLLRRKTVGWPCFWRIILQACIAGQWILVLVASSLADWNALVISIWIAFSAIASSHLYPSTVAARDWLHHVCKIRIKRIQAEFSSRRAMLAALVVVNPDTVEQKMAWIDPILSKSSSDRAEWQAALLEHIRCRDKTEKMPAEKYWWKWIVEGVCIGERLRHELQPPRTAHSFAEKRDLV